MIDDWWSFWFGVALASYVVALLWCSSALGRAARPRNHAGDSSQEATEKTDGTNGGSRMSATAKVDGRLVRFADGLWRYEDTGETVEDFEQTGTPCQGCGRVYVLDVVVPDDLWEIIKPEGKSRGAGMLCPVCIAHRLEEHLGFSAVHLVFPCWPNPVPRRSCCLRW